MDVQERTRLSPREYIALRGDYRVNIRLIFHPPLLPVYYARVADKESGELLAYLWFCQGREEWIMFRPDDATEEVEALFQGR